MYASNRLRESYKWYNMLHGNALHLFYKKMSTCVPLEKVLDTCKT